MALDFEEDSIHFVDVNHGFEDFIHVVEVKLDVFVEQVSVQVICSVGRDMLEFVLYYELLGPGDLAVVEGAFVQ